MVRIFKYGLLYNTIINRFKSGAMPVSISTLASWSRQSIAISFVQRSPLFNDTLCCFLGLTSGCSARNRRKNDRDTFFSISALLAFLLSGLYFHLPIPLNLQRLRFCRTFRILRTTPEICVWFRPWQARLRLTKYLTRLFSSFAVKISFLHQHCILQIDDCLLFWDL